jgi:hypothetical protein
MNCFGLTNFLESFYVSGSYNRSSKTKLKVFASDVFIFYFFIKKECGLYHLPKDTFNVNVK